MTGADYLESCPYKEECGDCICSPWGIHNPSRVSDERRILLVGFNAHDGGNPQHDVGTRGKYSEELKKMVRQEIEDNAMKSLSNLAPALAAFLSASPMAEVVDRINFCNLVLCADKRNPRSRPSETMAANCVKRLKSDGEHELIQRIKECRPTHILVMGDDARGLWDSAVEQPSRLMDALATHSPGVRVAFCYHPSQGWQSRGGGMSRDKYCELVAQELEAATPLLD